MKENEAPVVTATPGRRMVVEAVVTVDEMMIPVQRATRQAVSPGLHIDGRREWRYGENVFYLDPGASDESVVCMMRFYDGVDKL